MNLYAGFLLSLLFFAAVHESAAGTRRASSALRRARPFVGGSGDPISNSSTIPFVTLSTMRAHCDQQSDVVCAENWYSREALVSIVWPTVSAIGCQPWRQSWFGGRSSCWSGRRHRRRLQPRRSPRSVVELMTRSIVSRL